MAWALCLTTFFSRKMRNAPARALEPVSVTPYVVSRRGTESQRARPPRCEAAPPKPERRKASWGGFLKRPGTASFSFLIRAADPAPLTGSGCVGATEELAQPRGDEGVGRHQAGQGQRSDLGIPLVRIDVELSVWGGGLHGTHCTPTSSSKIAITRSATALASNESFRARAWLLARVSVARSLSKTSSRYASSLCA